MPVTIRLSRKFAERFGEDLADELVNWFNQVDTTYRSELRELNEQNFARFDAKLERRIAEVKSEIAGLTAELIKWMFLFWLGTVATMLSLGRLFLTG